MGEASPDPITVLQFVLILLIGECVNGWCAVAMWSKTLSEGEEDGKH